jgi:hypothetical protein
MQGEQVEPETSCKAHVTQMFSPAFAVAGTSQSLWDSEAQAYWQPRLVSLTI